MRRGLRSDISPVAAAAERVSSIFGGRRAIGLPPRQYAADAVGLVRVDRPV